MTHTCWRPLAALAAVALIGPAVQAQELLPMPGCCAREVTCTSHRMAADGMVEQTYPVGPLLHTFGCCPACPDMLVKFMTQAVSPETWSDHGGRGTMQFCPMNGTLVVNQTPKVQAQISALLSVMDKMAAGYGGPMSIMPVGMPLPPPPMPPPAQNPEPKQHFHFALDGVRIRTDDKTTVTIKHVEVEYAGDGIDADVAKWVISRGESEKKAEKETCGGAAAAGAALGASCGGVGAAAAGAALGATCGGVPGNAATKVEKPAEEKAENCQEETPCKTKAAPKVVQEEEDGED